MTDRTIHVWDQEEITLNSEVQMSNPYTSVDVWVDLDGPGFSGRVHGFWRGGNRFAVRVMPTTPGLWKWTSGATASDPGLVGKSGSFEAIAWTESELSQNPLRHGRIEPTANGRALQHADSRPFFLIGDTWWSVGTWRYPWRDSDEDHGIGPEMGLKEMTRFRKAQGYNCVAVIAALPAWRNDGKPATIVTEEGISIRNAWANLTTGSAKDMHDSQGGLPFAFPGRVPGYEDVFPDVDRLNPEYFDELDKKIGYLNSQGFVVFLEPTRRDHSMAWHRYHDWPKSYARFIQYIWARYGAYHVILSPIHLDSLAHSVKPWLYQQAIDLVISRYGMPPFVKLISANPHETVRRCFSDNCGWLTLHMTGNAERYHDKYEDYVAGDFFSKPARPSLNGEPHYAGWYDVRGGSAGGSREDDLDVRSAMYGNVLSGGLAGHIYGANGIWGGDVEPYAKDLMWDTLKWPSGGQLQYVRDFLLSVGDLYRELIPHRELILPNTSGPARGFRGWAFGSRTDDKKLFMLYFEPGCLTAKVAGALPGKSYAAKRMSPETGEWTNIDGGSLVSDEEGEIQLPIFPSDSDVAIRLWAE